MVAAIRQVVKVRPGGVVQVRSSRLKVGSEAEVIVLLPETPRKGAGRAGKRNGTTAVTRARGVSVAGMSKQVRGDIAEAHRVRKAIRAGREKLIPWEQVKRQLGLE